MKKIFVSCIPHQSSNAHWFFKKNYLFLWGEKFVVIASYCLVISSYQFPNYYSGILQFYLFWLILFNSSGEPKIPFVPYSDLYLQDVFDLTLWINPVLMINMCILIFIEPFLPQYIPHSDRHSWSPQIHDIIACLSRVQQFCVLGENYIIRIMWSFCCSYRNSFLQ